MLVVFVMSMNGKEGTSLLCEGFISFMLVVCFCDVSEWKGNKFVLCNVNLTSVLYGGTSLLYVMSVNADYP